MGFVEVGGDEEEGVEDKVREGVKRIVGSRKRSGGKLSSLVMLGIRVLLERLVKSKSTGNSSIPSRNDGCCDPRSGAGSGGTSSSSVVVDSGVTCSTLPLGYVSSWASIPRRSCRLR